MNYTHKDADGRLARVLAKDLANFYNAVLAVKLEDGTETIEAARGLQGDCFQFGETVFTPYSEWDEVPVDTPLKVSNDGRKWYNVHFAEYKCGRVHVWSGGRTSHSACDNRITLTFLHTRKCNGN